MDDPSFGTSGGLTKSDLEVSSSYSFLFLAAFTSASLHFLLFQELGLIEDQPTEGQDKVTAGDPITSSKSLLGTKEDVQANGGALHVLSMASLSFPKDKGRVLEININVFSKRTKSLITLPKEGAFVAVESSIPTPH